VRTLPKNAKCPIHGGLFCCGRTRPAADPYIRHGVKTLDDGREICTPAEVRRRKSILLKRDPACAACGKVFTDYRDVELAHKESKGMNGHKHDDRWENLVLMHRDENRECGSRPVGEYVAWRKAKGLPTP
jgi:5-methylcytosine-specific restriction endonuclease McrA